MAEHVYPDTRLEKSHTSWLFISSEVSIDLQKLTRLRSSTGLEKLPVPITFYLDVARRSRRFASKISLG